MATFEFRLSTKTQPGTGRSEVLIRLRHGDLDLYGKSGCFVSPENFQYYINTRKCEREGIRVPAQLKHTTKREGEKKGYYLLQKGDIFVKGTYGNEDWQHDKEAKEALQKVVCALAEAFEGECDKSIINRAWIQSQINRCNHPEQFAKASAPQVSIYEHGKRYLAAKEIEESTRRGLRVLLRTMYRFEYFKRATDSPKFSWLADDLCKEHLEDFKDYLRNEKDLADEYPKIFEAIANAMSQELPEEMSASRRADTLSNKGDSSAKKMLGNLRPFLNWCHDEGIISTQPFNGYKNGKALYGRPWSLTSDEILKIADCDLSQRPQLAVQRDIFVFQCYIGCRVSDLLRLTPAHIHQEKASNGEDMYMLEYTAQKTKNDINPMQPRVPLSKRALAIVNKYANQTTDGRLLPFISSQKYNDAIKEIVKAAEITREVEVRDQHTGKTIMRPISEVIASHAGRRTFVGRLYKSVKDPNIIGRMSGHVEGSVAFTRYRDIDDEDLYTTINTID